MDKKTRDLAWACLPKEARDKIKIAYKSDYVSDRGYQPTRGMEVLQDVFGSHNLTSDAEPSELVFIQRAKLQEMFEVGDRSSCSTLAALFGDKCLPDKEPSVQVEPKFKVGDKVYQTSGTNRLEEYTVKKVYTDKNRGIVYDIQGLIDIIGVEENKLCLTCQNPYTEPETKTFRVGDKVRVKGEDKVREIFRILTDGYVMFGDKGHPYSIEDIELVEPETKESGNKEEKSGNYSKVPNQTKDNMEEKELNLCELLKGCEKEKFYSPTLGDAFIVQIRETSIHIVPCDEEHSERFLFINKCGIWTKGGQCTLYPSRALYEKYPLDAYSAWMEWKEAKRPKRWRANKGEEYFYFDDGGETYSAIEENSVADELRYSFNNYYHTPKGSQQAAEAVRETLMKFHEQTK